MKMWITRRKLYASALMLLGAVFILGSWHFGTDTLEASGGIRSIPIYCVDRGSEKIASITINAADGDEDTEAILDLLDKYNVKATFFFVGTWVRRYPDRVKEIATRGHELGNHSDTHPNMVNLPREAIRKEIDRVNIAVENLTGIRPVLFRPPSGAYSGTLVDAVRALDCEVVQWDVDSLDWKGYGATDMRHRVLSHIKPGSIVLFHINSKGIVTALDNILEQLTREGWTLVPVGELLLPAPYGIDHTGRQLEAVE